MSGVLGAYGTRKRRFGRLPNGQGRQYQATPSGLQPLFPVAAVFAATVLHRNLRNRGARRARYRPAG